MSKANYKIWRETETYVLIRDMGPWDRYPSITNAAEEVVKELAPMLRDRELYYIDSDGTTDRLLTMGGEFAGFKSGGPNG